MRASVGGRAPARPNATVWARRAKFPCRLGAWRTGVLEFEDARERIHPEDSGLVSMAGIALWPVNTEHAEAQGHGECL